MRPPVRWMIWVNVVLRWIAFPTLVASSLWVVSAVARAGEGTFWSADSYGGVMLAAALSGLALAIVRPTEGRNERERRRSLRSNARHAGVFWLACFIAVSVAITVATLLHRLPKELETPWLRARAPQTPICAQGPPRRPPCAEIGARQNPVTKQNSP